MARRKRVYDKPVHKDSRYDSQLVAQLIARVMQSGKKSLAERIVYTAIEQLNEKTETVDPLELFHRAIENAKGAGRTGRNQGNPQVHLQTGPDRREDSDDNESTAAARKQTAGWRCCSCGQPASPA